MTFFKCFMLNIDHLFTIKSESDVLAKNLAVYTVGLYRFRIQRHLSISNKENTMQTSHLFSHLFVSVKLFQVMRHRFISLLTMSVEKTFDRKFSLKPTFRRLEGEKNKQRHHARFRCVLHLYRKWQFAILQTWRYTLYQQSR